MITAVDTSVLLDIFTADPDFGPGSAAAVRRCIADGAMIASPVVWAETSATFPETLAAEQALERLRIEFSALDATAAFRAGEAWRAYRRAGGTRERVIADFLIAAHALLAADRLLTRDRGFYRRWFKGLKLLDPSATPPGDPPGPSPG